MEENFENAENRGIVQTNKQTNRTRNFPRRI